MERAPKAPFSFVASIPIGVECYFAALGCDALKRTPISRLRFVETAPARYVTRYGNCPKIRSSSACGRVAQLGEHLLCKQGVTGSSPVTSTISKAILAGALTSLWRAPTIGTKFLVMRSSE